MNNVSIVKEYVDKLNDDDLRRLYECHRDNLQGDRARLADFVSRDRGVERILRSTSCSMEWFDVVDEIGSIVSEKFEKSILMAS